MYRTNNPESSKAQEDFESASGTVKSLLHQHDTLSRESRAVLDVCQEAWALTGMSTALQISICRDTFAGTQLPSFRLHRCSYREP